VSTLQLLALPVAQAKACALRKYGCKVTFKGAGELCPKCRLYASCPDDRNGVMFREYVARGCRESNRGGVSLPGSNPDRRADWAWEKGDGPAVVDEAVAPAIAEAQALMERDSERTPARRRLRAKEEGVAKKICSICKERECRIGGGGRPLDFCGKCFYARYIEKKTRPAPRPAPTPEQEPSPAAGADSGDVAATSPANECTELVALPQPTEPAEPKNVDDELAPVMAFCVELHKSLALMPRVAEVTVTVTLKRDGSVAIAPPAFK
jgi:hypothetical protein